MTSPHAHGAPERGGGTKAADPALRTQLDHAQRQRDSLRAVLSTNFPRHFRDELAQTMSSPGGGEGMFGRLMGKMRTLPEDYQCEAININYFTNSNMFQKILEAPLEKKAGKNFGPPGNKKLIYFVRHHTQHAQYTTRTTHALPFLS